MMHPSDRIYDYKVLCASYDRIEAQIKEYANRGYQVDKAVPQGDYSVIMIMIKAI